MSFKQLLLLLWRSCKASFTGKLWKWLLGSSGGLFAILLAYRNFFDPHASTEISILAGAIFFLVLFFFRLILFFIYNAIAHFNYIFKESVYGDAIVLLKDAFGKIHYLRKKSRFDDNQFMDAMITICNHLKIIFDKITNVECSVSIKVPIKGPVSTNTVVQNLCRDKDHFSRDNSIYKELEHTIIGNSPYSSILNGFMSKDKSNFYYLNNDIKNTPHYRNTSAPAYPNGFPYNCELVCPILPLILDRDEENQEDYNIWGFLCVDCNSTNKFGNKYDLAIIQGVADGIYDVILKRNQIS